MDLKFHTGEGNFLGRNGFFKASGINVMPFGDRIVIAPITSKGVMGRCQIHIPVGDIEDLIEQLYNALPEGTQHYFPITSVHRDDIAEKFGPVAHEMTDDQMRELASDMADAYCGNGFHEDLELIYNDNYKPPYDAVFGYCKRCNHIFAIKDDEDCPVCGEPEKIDYVQNLAVKDDLVDRFADFDEEFPEEVYSKYFDLNEWVEKYQEFMEKHNLKYAKPEVIASDGKEEGVQV